MLKKLLSLLWNLRSPDEDIPCKPLELSFRSSNIIKSHNIHIEYTGKIPYGPCILVSNHLGYFDPLIISSIIPCRPIAKQELISWPLFGKCMQRLGLIFVQRGDVCSGFRALKSSRAALLRGEKVLVFPEGTTSNGAQVLPFKRGLFGLSKRLSVPIVPITVHFDDEDCCWWREEDDFLGHYIKQCKKNNITVRMHIGEPQSSANGETVEQYKSFIHAIISEELKRFRD